MNSEAKTVLKETEKRNSIGPYEIKGKPLGIGASANVYLVVDQFNQKFAIKELHPRNLSRKKAVKRFRQEFNVLKELKHQNVIDVIDFFQANGTYNLVMEYVDGVNLQTVIEKLSPLDLQSAFTISYICASCLDYIHSQGLVHRDLKPENILISRKGDLKITDFGIARLENMEMTTTGDFIGTPIYMPPEQMAGNVGKNIDERADIYSLGVLTYEMLKGDDPFGLKGCRNVYKVVKMIEHKQPPPLGLPDPEAEEIVMKMLARNPNERWQSSADLSAAMMPYAIRMNQSKAMLKELVTKAKAKPLRKKAAKKKKKAKVPVSKPPGFPDVDQRSWWVVLIGVILILGALASYLYINHKPGDSPESAESEPGISVTIDENVKPMLNIEEN